MRRPPPNAVDTRTGEVLRTLGEPFQPMGPKGCVWVACEAADGKARPYPPDVLARLGQPAEGAQDG
jgi:hypothetical protein